VLKIGSKAAMSEHAMKTFIGVQMLRNVRNWYARFERPISSASLIGGFVFDAVTLRRVDTFWENFWVVVHLLVVAVCIVLVSRQENKGVADSASTLDSTGDSSKVHFWLINLMQFFFGGLLSTLLVFYFRSGSFAASWPFFLVLGVAFVANESLKKYYARLGFQISLFYLSLFCFAIFIVPVIVHAMGPLVFLLSGVVSLALMRLFVFVLKAVAKENLERGKKELAIAIGSIFLAINLLYFLNVIPPLPLSLMDAGVSHSITRQANGAYALQSEEPGWLSFFRLVETVHLPPGAPLIAYSAVFSPTRLNTRIIHEWQHYDGKRGWLTASRVELPLLGGRGGGYRTYSMKAQVPPGAWRVNVESPNGALLGRLRFNVAAASSEPPLKTELKD
jgi:hypothetical protein